MLMAQLQMLHRRFEKLRDHIVRQRLQAINSATPNSGIAINSLTACGSTANPRRAASWIQVDILPEKNTYSCRMPTRDEKDRIALLQGTLDLLILRTLLFGRQHGQGIARAIQLLSGDELLVDHGSLYPALQRLETRGWIRAEWGTSDNNRKARFYLLTRTGRKQLVHETGQWQRLAAAIGRVLGASEVEG